MFYGLNQNHGYMIMDAVIIGTVLGAAICFQCFCILRSTVVLLMLEGRMERLEKKQWTCAYTPISTGAEDPITVI
jgi:hypothetical protein